MSDTALDDFKAHIATQRMAHRLVHRFAGEFTEKEWEAYKKKHPGADPKNHTIKKVEESKGEGAKAEDDASDENAEKIRPKEKEQEDVISMTFGEMPDRGDFERHIREAIDPDTEEPWLPEGQDYRVELKGTDAEVADLLDIESDGEWDVDEIYENVKKLNDFADQDDEWYVEEHGIDEGDVEEYREAAMSLASSIMQTLGYEWI
jgi:hypothetical protein